MILLCSFFNIQMWWTSDCLKIVWQKTINVGNKIQIQNAWQNDETCFSMTEVRMTIRIHNMLLVQQLFNPCKTDDLQHRTWSDLDNNTFDGQHFLGYKILCVPDDVNNLNVKFRRQHETVKRFELARHILRSRWIRSRCSLLNLDSWTKFHRHETI